MKAWQTSYPRFQWYEADGQRQPDTFAQDVARGLTAPRKWLPAKYFYDERGSRLFEQICALPEYYLYRAEREILAAYAPEIVAELDLLPLIELGPGNASKTRYLLEEYERRGHSFFYCPVDIARSMLYNTAQRLLQTYPHMVIRALHADFAADPRVIATLGLERKAVAFLGSSLGNFTPEESVTFLRHIAALLAPEDVLLLGVDLKKAPAILVPAYDDAQGVTAAFNLNLLQRINRELGADFDLQSFAHLALYNEEYGRIEMHLQSCRAQQVSIAKIASTVSFARGETIHTENSYKYTVEEVEELGSKAHLRLTRTWFDRRHYVLVALFRRESGTLC